jgi:hypothetical protein
MYPPKTRWLTRIAAYVAAIVTGLSVVVATALALDLRDPEPSGPVVLLVLGAAAVVAIFLGRVIYRGVFSLLSGILNRRV